MKTTKDGNVKLEKGEIRVGNFFIRDEGENEHIKVTDLNSCFSLRVLKRMPLGIWLENVMDIARTDEKGMDTLKTWIAVMWSVLAVVPDDEFVSVMIREAHNALHRHPDWYGYKASDDEKENEEAAKEVKEMADFEQELKDLEAKEGENQESAHDGGEETGRG